MVVLQVTVHEAGEKFTVVPAGKAEVVMKSTGPGEPEVSVAVRVAAAELPCATVTPCCPDKDQTNPDPPEGVVMVRLTGVFAE